MSVSKDKPLPPKQLKASQILAQIDEESEANDSRKEGRNETLPEKSLSIPHFPFMTKREDGEILQIGTDTWRVSFDGEKIALQSSGVRFFTDLYKNFRRAIFVVRKDCISRTGSKMRNRIAVDPYPSSQSDLCKIWCYQLSRPNPHLHECPSMT